MPVVITTPPVVEPVASVPGQPAQSGGNMGKLILIFGLSGIAAFVVLGLVFHPKDGVAADHTDGRVRHAQCYALGGNVITLPSGRAGCQVENAVFSLTD